MKTPIPACLTLVQHFKNLRDFVLAEYFSMETTDREFARLAIRLYEGRF